MPRSATDVMQEIIYSAVLDSLAALKSASKGMPNTLLRDLNAIHANSTFADLPPELQAAITASVRSAFNRLLKEGYSVSHGQPAPPRTPPAGRGNGPPRRKDGPPRRPPTEGGRPSRPGGPRPNRKPGPRGPGGGGGGRG